MLSIIYQKNWNISHTHYEKNEIDSFWVLKFCWILFLTRLYFWKDKKNSKNVIFLDQCLCHLRSMWLKDAFHFEIKIINFALYAMVIFYDRSRSIFRIFLWKYVNNSFYFVFCSGNSVADTYFKEESDPIWISRLKIIFRD